MAGRSGQRRDFVARSAFRYEFALEKRFSVAVETTATCSTRRQLTARQDPIPPMIVMNKDTAADIETRTMEVGFALTIGKECVFKRTHYLSKYSQHRIQ